MSLTSAAPLTAVRAIVVDTETTGLDSRSARIVQIAAIGLLNGTIEPVAAIDTLVDPGIPIPKAATAIHGISSEHLQDAPAMSHLAADLDRLLEGAVMIGHSTAYDLAMLAREYEIAGRPWRAPRALDVRPLARIAVPTLADHSLDRLCDWAGIVIHGRHSALGDARATAELFLKLVPLLRERGIRTVAEAEAACRRVAALESGGTFTTEPIAPPSPHEAALVGLDSFAYRHRVADVMTAPAVFAAPDLPVRDVLRELVDRRISSVLVRRPQGGVAIATERDLLRALHECGPAGFDMPVARIANGPIETVRESDHLYRAIGRIGRLGFRHLGVVDATGEVVGMVTTRNLLRHRSSSAIILGDEIEAAQDAPMLAASWAKLPALAGGLLREGVETHAIAGVISAEILGLTRRAALLAEQRLVANGNGPPPRPYAVLVLGSAGRGESLLSADQDNAIIFADGADGSDAGEAQGYFETLGRLMNDILDAAGLARCKGGVMAGNRAWCMPLAEWRGTVETWIRRHSPQDLLDADIFFDAMPAHGDHGLAETIWRHAFETARPAIGFQKLLTELARDRPAALTLLGNLRGDEKNRIDLKKAGLMPLFTCARVLAIRHGVRERATSARLAPLPDRGVGSPQIIGEIVEAQGLLMSEILGQQLVDIEAGIPPSARVDIGRLGRDRRKAVKAALSAVDEIIGLVSEGRI